MGRSLALKRRGRPGDPTAGGLVGSIRGVGRGRLEARAHPAKGWARVQGSSSSQRPLLLTCNMSWSEGAMSIPVSIQAPAIVHSVGAVDAGGPSRVAEVATIFETSRGR